MENRDMKILITNDDGVFADGIIELAKELEKHYSVCIVAPNCQKSATSHSITIDKPLIIKEEKLEGIKSRAFSISGTPADCTRVGVNKIMDGKVDMVISGINNGFNLGTDILYSGTVSAAIEAAILKIPSIAFSCDGNSGSYKECAKIAKNFIEKLEKYPLKNDLVLNVNFPSLKNVNLKKNYEFKVSKMGEKKYDNLYVETLNEDGSKSINISGTPIKNNEADTDVLNIENGYVTITPLHYDLTNFKILYEIEEKLI